MGAVVLLVLLLLACAAQSALPSVGFLGGAKWPLVAAVVLYYSLRHGPGYVVAAAVLAGLAVDGLSTVSCGVPVVLYVVIGLAVWCVREWVNSESPGVVCLIGGVAVVCLTLAWGWWLARRGLVDMAPAAVFGRAMGTGLLGCAAAPLAVFAGGWLDRAAGVKVRRSDASGL
jgi:rod shape-determining protein MreD